MITYSAGTRDAIAATVAARVDAGSGPGKIRIYTANRATLLVEVVLPDPAFTSPSNGEVSLASLSEGTVVSGGTASVYDMTDSNNNIVISGSVGTFGADLNLKTDVLTVDDVIEVEGFTYVAPE